MSLQVTTLCVTGASRGIGLAIALRAARDGANVAIAAKTAEPHKHLPGTIFTAAKEIEDACGKALPLIVDVRETFLTSKACIPHLKRASNPHVLMLSPPLDMSPRWFGTHVAYTMAKFGMSMCVLGMAAEFKDDGIAFNALWPRTGIATAAIQFALGGDEGMRRCRTTDIMSDA